MSHLLLKSLNDELDAIEQLIDSTEKQYRQAFNRWLSTVRSEEIASKVRAALEVGDVEGALQIINDETSLFGPFIYQMIIAGAIDESKRLYQKLNFPRFVAFDPTQATIIAATKENFLREFNQSTRNSFYAIVVESKTMGETAKETAERLTRKIGLTTKQIDAAGKYRVVLETRSRADQESGKKFLTKKQIDRMVLAYEKKAVRNRLALLSRTEAHSIVNTARHAAFRQLLLANGIPESQAGKQWLSSRDTRVRDQHIVLDDSSVIPLSRPFIAPNGDRLMFPGDRSLGASASNICNCRCAVIYSLLQGNL